MGWSLGFDTSWNRDIGYGVIAYCDHPACNKEIDRGLSYVCGGDPYGGDSGCGLFFCDEHLQYCVDKNSDVSQQLCERCSDGEEPFNAKPDHPEWIKQKQDKCPRCGKLPRYIGNQKSICSQCDGEIASMFSLNNQESKDEAKRKMLEEGEKRKKLYKEHGFEDVSAEEIKERIDEAIPKVALWEKEPKDD